MDNVKKGLTNTRYGYYDALRGFTMILVVYSHVFFLSMDGLMPSTNLFFVTFRMPLFFFVSGFFAFKALDKWNKSRIKDIVFRKFKVQIIGASIFIAVNVALCHHQIITIKNFINPGGYWFTFALFRIFIIYIATVILVKYIHKPYLFWPIIGFITALCVVTYFCIRTQDYHTFFPFAVKVVINLISINGILYLPFFMLGAYARSRMGLFEKFLDLEI